MHIVIFTVEVTDLVPVGLFSNTLRNFFCTIQVYNVLYTNQYEPAWLKQKAQISVHIFVYSLM